MSYEIYIDVRHYRRHNEYLEEKLSAAFRYADGQTPIEHVVTALREFADQLEEQGTL